MSDTVDQIKERLSILDVVAPYVELHKAGKSYKGKSPFSNERTPSFFVSPDRGMYYCFSTNQGGDIFTFIEAIEGVDFKGALKILAEKAGIELTPENPETRSKRERQFAVLDEATSFFASFLPHDEDAHKYLTARGVHDETVATWRLGYAPGPPHHGWRELREHLLKRGYTDDELIAVGLLKPGVEGREPYDLFRDRVVFPIFDVSGRVIAFSGRALHENEKAPKYVNSPETDLFHKSEALYGYHQAKGGIRALDFTLIVEGQFDVVLAHQTGYTNAVAVSGTAMTAAHVELFRRFSERAVLALDSDAAGLRAMKHAAELILARGMDVKVAMLPDGTDPADMIAEDPTAFKQSVGASMHVIECLLGVLKEHARDERTYKLRVRDEVIPFLALIQSSIERDHFAGIIAEALSSTHESVMLELSRFMRADKEREVVSSSEFPAVTIPTTSNHSSRREALEQYACALDQVLNEPARTIFKKKFEQVCKKTIEDIQATQDISAIERERFRLEEELPVLNPKTLSEQLASLLTELRERILREEIKVLRTQITEAERLGSTADIESLLITLNDLQKQLGEVPFDPTVFLDDR